MGIASGECFSGVGEAGDIDEFEGDMLFQMWGGVDGRVVFVKEGRNRMIIGNEGMERWRPAPLGRCAIGF